VTGRPQLAWIAPGDPPDAFPEPALALTEPNGLLAAGGDLSPARLLAAYRKGIFPWFSDGQPILWWCPDPRAVLLPAELHISRRLRRTLRSGRFEVSVDQCFDRVISLCASTRRESGTWLTPDMIRAYRELHALGLAHSIEAWQEGEIAGGVYGVALGGIFFGESMVSLRRDGSKVALAKLVSLARRTGIEMIDCQIPNPHLSRLGSREIPRRDFLRALPRLVSVPPMQRVRPEPPLSTATLEGA
jgi:leucyl/phenylalanyl-tRNA--protein transferase